ncbi:MAG: hypothetical protein IKJ59_06215 [Clostridia bacterium]|nr:hypothetical protein [Clostridia bacterium]
MTSIKSFSKKAIAVLIAIIMVISVIPMTAMAAPASDLPANMVDSAILRALEYTGYDVQAQKDNGTLYQSGSYSSKTPANIRSNIHYGTALSGKETVANATTKTGLAPDIAKFEQYGLCCAGFVTYYVCNYLPNIEGVDTQFITNAINATGWNSQAVVTWQKALDNLIAAGQIEKIGTSPSNVNRSKLAPGDLIIFGNDEDSTTHIGVYSGTYNGRDFMIHLGNDMGPEIMPVDWMSNSSNGAKTSDPNGYYHLPQDIYKNDGYIKVTKKDTDGKALANAVFTATDSSSGKQYILGPTDSNGYAKVTVPYGTYNIKETSFPTNYRAYGTSSWTATINSNTPNGTYSFSAVNELIPGSCKVIKVSEDGKVDGIEFTITGNGANKTVTTSNGGQAVFSDLKPGTYTVTEESIGHYKPVSNQTVTVISGQTSIVNFSNTLKRGNLQVKKTSVDKKNGNIEFKLSGKSLSGEYIEQYAVTNSSGIATFRNILINKNASYKLEEINTPERYEPLPSKQITIEWDKTTYVTVENKLKSGKIDVIKTSEDNKIEGVKFRLTGTSLGEKYYDLTVQTGKNGNAGWRIPISGDEPYIIEEINVPFYYVPNKPQQAFVEWEDLVILNFHNELKKGNLTVRKNSEDGIVEGMKFRLQGTSFSGIKVDEYATTDKNGVAQFKNILIGSDYVLSEVNTPKRYVVPTEQIVDIAWNKTTEVKVNNVLKKWRANVFKIDGYLYWPEPVSIEEIETKPLSLSSNDFNSDELVDLYGYPFGIAQGNATLKGAVYGVYKNDELVDTYTTDKNGWFITKYYPIGDNNKWTIKEISPSQGYLLDETIYKINSDPGYYSEELNTEYLNVLEAVIRGKIEIFKHYGDGNTTDLVTPEENAVFQVYLKSAGSYDNAKSTERSELVTNSYGYAITKDLPYGVYIVKQVAGKEGKELMPPFEVTITDNGRTYPFFINNATFEADIEIVKKDAETGKVIPASGIGFKVRNKDTGEYVVQHINYPTPIDIEIYYTDVTGKLMLPSALPYGNYEIIEQNTCHGYVLDTTPVAFKVDGKKDVVTVTKSNYAQKGTITITKSGEVFSSVAENDDIYQPIYEIKGLKDATYEVIASEDVITLDGTLRYEKGQVVATITTGKDGTATTEPLYLGKYEIREVKAPYGMVLNSKPVNVELVYAGELIEITNTSASFTNERQKIVIDLKKSIEKDQVFNVGFNDEITNVQFGLYAAKDMTAADGKVIPKNALIETADCDIDGRITFKTDLPVDTSVYVKEINSDCHYILDDEFYHVNFAYTGQETETVHITLNDGEVIENKIIRGNIIGKKVDEDGFEICGALFGLFSADETDFTEDTAILTCKSNEIGIFYFTNVPYGKYIVREIKAAPAFVLNETNYEISIKEDMEIVEIGVENKFITGTVKTIKVDKDYPENTLAGAVFEIYVDVNGNKEFDKDIDILIGEMSEGENGIYTMGNLRYNGYFLHEKTAPEGFLKDDGYYYFEIRENDVVINIENEAGVGFINEAIKGNVEVIKVDAEFTDTKLFGAVFKIYEDTNKNGEYDKSDKFVTKLTDNDGIYRATDIRYGSYFLIEKTSPIGFLADTNVFKFDIRNDGETVVISNTEDGLFINKAITGELEITKTDLADGKPLAKVGFRVKDENGNTVAEGYTDKNGVVKFTLRYGKYTYTEFAALEGYIEDTKEYPFEITEDGQVIKVKITNKKIPVPEKTKEPTSPQTGDKSSTGFWIGLGSVSLGGLISLAFIYFKQNNDSNDEE